MSIYQKNIFSFLHIYCFLKKILYNNISVRIPILSPHDKQRAASLRRKGKAVETKKNYKWLVLLTMALGAFMTYWTNAAFNICMPRLCQDFAVSEAQVTILQTVYFLALACFTLPFGKIGGNIGYNKVYVTGAVLATLLTGLTPVVAKNFTTLIVMRALTGVALAMCISVSQAVLSLVFPPEERGKAMGLNSMLIAGTGMLGELCGGWFVNFWRVIFFIPIPFGIVCVIMAVKLLKGLKPQQSTKIDFLGASFIILFLAALTMLLRKANIFPNHNGLILGILAGLFLAAFIITESRSKHPLMSLKLFKIKSFTLGYILMFGAYVTNTMANTTRTFFVVNVMGYTEKVAGVLAVLCSIAIALFATGFGSLSDKIGTKKIVVTALILQAIALATYAMCIGSTPLFLFGALMLFYGVSSSMFYSPNVSACMSSVPTSEVGMASGMNSAVRSIAQAIGSSLYALIISGRKSVYAKTDLNDAWIYNFAQRDMLLICAAALAVLVVFAVIMLPKDTKSFKDLKRRNAQ